VIVIPGKGQDGYSKYGHLTNSLQLTPNSLVQSECGRIRRRSQVARRWRSALFGAAEDWALGDLGRNVARNVEIKARVEDVVAVRLLLDELAESGPTELKQVDTFYNCSVGRLKLREILGAHAELISYVRSDMAGPKVSEYTRVPVESPQSLDAALASSLGIRGVVRKTRSIYMVGKTRVHLDTVEGLGEFLELEVAIGETQSVDDGKDIAGNLLGSLGIAPRNLVEGAYIDLLESSGCLTTRCT